MSNEWYGVLKPDDRLTQGELIFDCPLATWKNDSSITEKQNGDEIEYLDSIIEVVQVDVIVMTQSCDLYYPKVRNVVLCPHYSLTQYRKLWEEEMRSREQNPTEKAWKRHCEDMCEGLIWNLTILNKNEKANLEMEHRVVDFHEIFTIPISFLEHTIKKKKSERFYLLPPYREHLSQSFARFFMRVGLPLPVRIF